MIASAQSLDRAERQLAGVGHRAGVERRDLVVLRSVLQKNDAVNLSAHLLHQRGVDAGRLEPLPILAEVLPGRGHQPRPLAQQRERVGDVRARTRRAACPSCPRGS